MLLRTEVVTPWVPLTIIADDGVVVSSWFGPAPLRCVNMSAAVSAVSSLSGVTQAVEDWLAGDLHALNRVSVMQPGGAFFQQVWTSMRHIAPGEMSSYSQLAKQAGRPRAARAAGSACATNAVAPFVPCHRVVRADGDIGAYGYGSQLKRALLVHEGAL